MRMRHSRIAATLAVVLATGTACGGTADPGSGAPDGVWEVTDYGTVLDVRGDLLQTYQVTSISCLKGDAGTGPDHRFTLPGSDVYTVRPGAGPDRALLHVDGSPGDLALRRLPRLPEACDAPPPPAFDVFWQTFREHYPFFAMKGVDWQQVRDRFRERAVTADDPGLFAALRDMVAPLNDMHVMVSAGDLGRFTMVRPGTEMPTRDLDTKVREHIRRRDLGDQPFTEFAGGRIAFATLPGHPEYGYLRVSGFAGYTAAHTFAADSAELDRAMDAILTPGLLGRMRGLILDLRVNGGGADSLGLQLAGRLTDRAYFAYTKKTAGTDARTFSVEPGRTRYTGPVAILTGGSTVSAGETFTQAMMRRPGKTVRIGQPTQGVFSDVLERKLPGAGHDDWAFALPNEIFLTADGRAFDGTGIPPELAEPVFTDEEFAQDRDSAFDRAVAWFGS
ncbi:S41 family peptidase [Nocardia arthritidis]|nr:S41 family peptidase [Nocardia arthritidis]